MFLDAGTIQRFVKRDPLILNKISVDSSFKKCFLQFPNIIKIKGVGPGIHLSRSGIRIQNTATTGTE